MEHPLMDSRPMPEAMKIEEISFPNGNRALAVIPPIGTRATELVRALGIPKPGSVIMIAGGAASMDEHDHLNLTRLFTDGIAHIAATYNALVIDGGTQSGVMELMGQGIAKQQQRPMLLGISPAGKVTYPGKTRHRVGSDEVTLDPNHSHFVLVETNEWGGETETMYELANVFSEGCPSVAILINGGDIAKNEVLYNVRQRRPIIVIEGSGRFADEIARNIHAKSSFDSDPDVTEITSQGKLYVFPITGSKLELEQLIKHLLDEQ
jgi:TRPM family ion channel